MKLDIEIPNWFNLERCLEATAKFNNLTVEDVED